MPPKKKLGKELPVEGSSQAVGEQVPTTAQTTTHIPQTLHPQPSTNLHAATANLTEQSTAQAEVLVMNTSTPNTAPPPSHQYQTIETKEDMLQASEEEIEAVIEDELVCLRQENECLRLMQEHLARRKVVAKRSQVMPQQIEQERITQAELWGEIEYLRQQEQEPSMQEPPLQQQQPQHPLHQ
jgi:ABC-type Fe2+-enterobactin transport system substrate-binding protein